MSFFIYLAAVILILVSFIHFYWAFGGRWGGSAAIPQKIEGGVLFRPRKLETIMVAFLILVVCFMLMAQTEMLSFFQASPFTKWSCSFFAFVFFIRSVGDFKYLGLFKKIKGTQFSKYDTWFYSPLCLFLSLSFVISL